MSTSQMYLDNPFPSQVVVRDGMDSWTDETTEHYPSEAIQDGTM